MSNKFIFQILSLWAAFIIDCREAPAASLDLSDFSCAALARDDTYNDPALKDYRMLVGTADGWLFRSDADLKERFFLTAHTADYFRRFNAALQYKGTALVIALTPPRGLAAFPQLPPGWSGQYDPARTEQNYRSLAQRLRDQQILVSTLQDLQPDFFYAADNHWTPRGAMAMAKQTAVDIQNFAAYKSLKRRRFETSIRPSNGETAPGQYRQKVAEICGHEISPAKIATLYETNRLGGKIDEDALFGTEAAPEIILAGASNSVPGAPSYANFAGFLKEYVGADIDNQSISGGGLQGSILRYLTQNADKAPPAKILIWEMAAYYGFNRPDFFREIIPAAYGTCAPEKAIASAARVAGPNDKILLDRLEDKNVQGNQYYIALSFNKNPPRSFQLRFAHQDGRQDIIRLRRDKRSFPEEYKNFYAELGDIDSPLAEIAVEGLQKTLQADIRICKVSASERILPSAGLFKSARRIISDFFQRISAFLQRPSYIQIHRIEDHEPLTFNLPDMDAYTMAAVIKKIPVSRKGEIRIAPMKEAPVLGKFSFDRRLLEMRGLQRRDEPLAIHIRAGDYDFKSLVGFLRNNDAIEEKAEGFLVKMPIAIYPGASLTIKNIGKPVLLSQQRGAFIASAGQFFVVDAALTGWNETKREPAETDSAARIFRPFIVAWDGSETYMARAHIAHLGYNSAKSYGFSASVNEDLQSRAAEKTSPPTGWVIDSVIEDLYFGFYAAGADHFVIHRNSYRDNIIYGIDPHDGSSNLIISENTVSGSKARHGIILSRGVVDSVIVGNIVENNAGSGIMLDRNSSNNIIANNNVRGNQGDGIALYESPETSLSGNIIEHNNGAGVRLRNSLAVDIAGGRIALNGRQAFIVVQDSLQGSGRDFIRDPVVPHTNAVIDGVALESNGGILKSAGFQSLAFRHMVWPGASLNGRHYYGDLEHFEKRIIDFEKRGENFIITGGAAGFP